MILADLQALGGGPCDRPSSCWPRLIIEPSVGFYNLPNFSNFNLPPNTMNGILFGAGNGSINGTTKSDNNSFPRGQRHRRVRARCTAADRIWLAASVLAQPVLDALTSATSLRAGGLFFAFGGEALAGAAPAERTAEHAGVVEFELKLIQPFDRFS